MNDRIIFHIDVNSAFLSWEAVYRLEYLGEKLDLRTIPSAVGGDIATRHGVILAKSTPAKKYNIQTGEPVVDALRKCPKLVLVSPNHTLYKKNSQAFMDILRKYTDKVEPFSIDEAFMDMTGALGSFETPEAAAAVIKDEICDTLGFTVNVGISTNKLLAKMASDFKKPNLVHTLYPWEIEEKMWPMPIRELFLVGGASERKLKSLGIHTIGDLAETDVNILKKVLKKHGETIWNYANGRDLSVVESVPAENKGYGNSQTLSADVTDVSEAKKILLSLSENIGKRLRKDGVRIGVVSITIRYQDLSNVSHQRVLSAPTNITKEIYESSCQLFEELWNGVPIRLLGVQTSKVSTQDVGRQMSMFDDVDYEKLEKLDKAVDSIREKFGSGAICRASFLKRD